MLTFMNDTLKPNDGKQSAGNRCSCNGAQDDQPEETSSIPPAFSFEKHLGPGDGRLGRHTGKEEIK